MRARNLKVWSYSKHVAFTIIRHLQIKHYAMGNHALQTLRKLRWQIGNEDTMLLRRKTDFLRQ